MRVTIQPRSCIGSQDTPQSRHHPSTRVTIQPKDLALARLKTSPISPPSIHACHKTPPISPPSIHVSPFGSSAIMLPQEARHTISPPSHAKRVTLVDCGESGHRFGALFDRVLVYFICTSTIIYIFFLFAFEVLCVTKIEGPWGHREHWYFRIYMVLVYFICMEFGKLVTNLFV